MREDRTHSLSTGATVTAILLALLIPGFALAFGPATGLAQAAESSEVWRAERCAQSFRRVILLEDSLARFDASPVVAQRQRELEEARRYHDQVRRERGRVEIEGHTNATDDELDAIARYLAISPWRGGSLSVFFDTALTAAMAKQNELQKAYDLTAGDRGRMTAELDQLRQSRESLGCAAGSPGTPGGRYTLDMVQAYLTDLPALLRGGGTSAWNAWSVGGWTQAQRVTLEQAIRKYLSLRSGNLRRCDPSLTPAQYQPHFTSDEIAVLERKCIVLLTLFLDYQLPDDTAGTSQPGAVWPNGTTLLSDRMLRAWLAAERLTMMGRSTDASQEYRPESYMPEQRARLEAALGDYINQSTQFAIDLGQGFNPTVYAKFCANPPPEPLYYRSMTREERALLNARCAEIHAILVEHRVNVEIAPANQAPPAGTPTSPEPTGLPPVGRVRIRQVEGSGTVAVTNRQDQEGRRRPLGRGELAGPGDEIWVPRGTTIEILLPNGSTLRLKENTILNVDDMTVRPRFRLDRGSVDVHVNPSGAPGAPPYSDFTIETPGAVVTAKGTVFTVTYDPATGLTTVSVQEGVVEVHPSAAGAPTIVLRAGDTVTVAGVRTITTGGGDAPTPPETQTGGMPTSPEGLGPDGLANVWRWWSDGDWSGTWTRRGSSGDFDATYRSPNAAPVTTVERLTRSGSSITVQRISGSDGVLCALRGELATGGREIKGTGNCTNNASGWSFTLTSDIAAGDPTAPTADGTPAPPSPPESGATSPSRLTSFQATWVGMDADRIGKGAEARPDGSPDAHLRIQASFSFWQDVTHIALFSSDAAGNPAGGQAWHTQNSGQWLLGVLLDGLNLNTRHVQTLGTFSGTIGFDLYAGDSGWFRPGEWLLVEMGMGPGEAVTQIVQVGDVTPTTAGQPSTPMPPVAGETGACSIAGLWNGNSNGFRSDWTFTATGEDRYDVQESAGGGGVGTATLSGRRIQTEWRSGGWSGTFTVDLDESCMTASGQQVIHTGEPGTHTMTLRRSGAPEPAPPASACGYTLGSEIYAKWIATGGESGYLGCPIMNEAPAAPSPQGTTGSYAEFGGGNGGFIVRHGSGSRAGQAFDVNGCIYREYNSKGGSSSWLGFPLGDAYEIAIGSRQDFEGGYIAWDSRTRFCEGYRNDQPVPAGIGPVAESAVPGTVWTVTVPDGWTGTWTRRGGNDFDIVWIQGAQRITGTMILVLRGDQVVGKESTKTDGHACEFTGGLEASRTRASGTFVCPSYDPNRILSWSAVIDAATPLLPPPPNIPRDVTVGYGFDWIGMDADFVGQGGSASPDGAADGHFTFTYDTDINPYEVRSIAVMSSDSAGNPTGGQVWHTRDAAAWLLGVVDRGRRLNQGHVTSLGGHEGFRRFDLYAASSGWFNPGQYFVIEVDMGGGAPLRGVVQVPPSFQPDLVPPDDPPPPPVQFTGSVTTDRYDYRQGDPITVTFQGFPGTYDWIAIADADADPESTIAWQWTDGSTTTGQPAGTPRREGTLSFSGLGPGEYEVRAFLDWPNGRHVVRAAQFFTVEAAPVAQLPVTPPAGTCDITGQWDGTIEGHGADVWTFTPLAEGGYKAVETGLGGASGLATVAGRRVSIDWSTGSGWTGNLTVDLDPSCTSGTGVDVIHTGSPGTHATTLRRSGLGLAELAGTWRWFNGWTVVIEPNGTFRSSQGPSGTVEVVDPAARRIQMAWSHGYVDELVLSSDGRRLDGRNQEGATVWGERETAAAGGGDEGIFVDARSASPVTTPFALDAGRWYVLEASGTFSAWDIDADKIDAVWCYWPSRCSTPEHWQQLRVDGQGLSDLSAAAGGPSPLPYDPSHVYRVHIQGRGRPLELVVLDAWTGAGGGQSAYDNGGGFRVRVAPAP